MSTFMKYEEMRERKKGSMIGDVRENAKREEKKKV